MWFILFIVCPPNKRLSILHWRHFPRKLITMKVHSFIFELRSLIILKWQWAKCMDKFKYFLPFSWLPIKGKELLKNFENAISKPLELEIFLGRHAQDCTWCLYLWHWTSELHVKWKYCFVVNIIYFLWNMFSWIFYTLKSAV